MESESSTSRLGIPKKAGLVALGLAVAVLVLELALRLLGCAFLQSRQVARPDVAHQGHYRILCIGESTTADMTFRGNESYPAQLERILNERSRTAEFTVINRGVPAAHTDRLVDELSRNLDRHEPDMVVAMMGINDRGTANPVLQASGGSRVWKLAKMFYYTLLPQVSSYSPQLDPLEGLANDQAKAHAVLTRKAAADHIIAGRYAEAEKLLISLLESKVVIQRVRTYAQLAVLNWQRGNDRDATRYHEKFETWHRTYDNTKTTNSYATIQRILAERDVFLLAVQYPGRAVEPLARLVQTGSRVAIVDNEKLFIDAVKSQPVGELYRDLFAGIFGHLTAHGNALLAENVAAAILDLLDQGKPVVRAPR